MAERKPAVSPPAEWFERVARKSRVVFFSLRVAPDVAYEYLSDAVEDLIGVTAAQGLTDPDAVHSRIDPDFLAILAGALTTPPGRQISVELKWRHRNGTPLYTRCWMQARQRPDGSVVAEGTVAEITELRDTQAELRNSEQRYRLLAENAWEVIWTMALDGSITYVSPAVERVRGITPEEARHQSLEEIHPPLSAASVAAYYEKLFAAIASGEEPPIFRGEHEYYRRDGSIMTGELQVIPHVDAEGHVVEILGVTRDISERKALEEELKRLAVTDGVTGVWNRRHGEELLDADLQSALRHGDGLCVLMVDVDRFKTINDTHGHQMGDQVLIDIAHALKTTVRSGDVVVRWGGDEFLVLLRQCTSDGAALVAESVRHRIASLGFDVGQVTVSVGLAELRAGDDAKQLIERADEALYEAKRSGRNTVVA